MFFKHAPLNHNDISGRWRMIVHIDAAVETDIETKNRVKKMRWTDIGQHNNLVQGNNNLVYNSIDI